MPNVKTVEITDNEDGQRLDNYLIRELKGVPKSHVYRLIRSGQVRVNKKRAKVGQHLQLGDVVRIPPVRVSEKNDVWVTPGLAETLLNAILVEDEHIIAINKPAGLPVHAGSGSDLGVIEAFRHIRQDLTHLSLVHRLDKDTSGCLILAKNRPTLLALQSLFVSRDVEKVYWACLENAWDKRKTLTVKTALDKHQAAVDGASMKVSDEGKWSETRFTLLKTSDRYSWVEVIPKTGRMHQIRVHAAHIGHPVLGDRRYGHEDSVGRGTLFKKRLYLHARSIQFNLCGQHYQLEAALDEAFEQAVAKIGVISPC